MSSQTPLARFSPEEIKKATRVYWTINWCWRVAVVAVTFALLYAAPQLPTFVTHLVLVLIMGFAIWLGNYFALARLERVGFQSQAKEIRTLASRVMPKFAFDVAIPNLFDRYKAIIIFAAIWLVLFGTFCWMGRGFASWDDAQTSALAALIFAIAMFIIVGYLFPQSQIIQSFKRLIKDTWGASDSEYVKYVPWTRVAKIREVRDWNFKNELTVCQFSFFDENETLIFRANVPPEFYGAVFHQIEARLENPCISIEYSNHRLV